MTVQLTSDVYYDPYDYDIYCKPYETYRRLRDEAPLYYNAEYDFYAVSRFDDVERVLVDRETFISSRGVVLEQIKSDIPLPPGTVIFEDEPTHSIHRGLLSRVFTPKKMNALEPKVREFCRFLLERVDQKGFDFVVEYATQVPMMVFGMLLGIPEEKQESVRAFVDANLRNEPGKPLEFTPEYYDGAFYAEYVDWRYTNPSDDLTTALITAEFEDEHGVVRRLARDEVLAYVNILSSAGNETTSRLIGWTGMLLSRHPDIRREIAADRELIPGAIEEVLRYEPPPYAIGRYVDRDVEIHGQTVPAGSALLSLPGAANRDERRVPDPEVFDIHKQMGHHFSFGYGSHFCLGAALARLEGRVALEEMIRRFPDWEADEDNSRMGGHVRGWEQLPVSIT